MRCGWTLSVGTDGDRPVPAQFTGDAPMVHRGCRWPVDGKDELLQPQLNGEVPEVDPFVRPGEVARQARHPLLAVLAETAECAVAEVSTRGPVKPRQELCERRGRPWHQRVEGPRQQSAAPTATGRAGHAGPSPTGIPPRRPPARRSASLRPRISQTREQPQREQEVHASPRRQLTQPTLHRPGLLQGVIDHLERQVLGHLTTPRGASA